jgi:type IV secretion system protein VirB10
MSDLKHEPLQQSPASPEDDAGGSVEPTERAALESERGIASISRSRSLQARLSNLLAMGLMSTLGLGLLSWYYVQTYAHRSRVRETARNAVTARAQGEMPLPALGAIDPPAPVAVPAIERLLGPAPAAPAETLPVSPLEPPPKNIGGRAHPSARNRALERKLAGPVLTEPNALQGSGASTRTTELMTETASTAGPRNPGAEEPTGVGGEEGAGRAEASGVVAGLLRPTITPTVRASVLPTQELLLPKGAFIDCTLETAIDSSLPGLTTCITATDTFGADGQVVLLERGTKLVGETRGIVQQGASRVFVLWTEARTPTGVVVPLASPGTDELGRSGLPGAVNRHFFERFGAALLISIIDGVIQAEVAAHSNGGAVIYNPTTSEDVMTEVLKSTVNIPPTVVKANGDRIQVLVARDLDFRSVYELRTVSSK